MYTLRLCIIASALLLIGAACTPQNINTASDGGVWRTPDQGDSWEERNTIFEDRGRKANIANLNVRKIFFSPTDERKIFLISEKNGLWISWNQGLNWDSILRSNNVRDALIDPRNARVMYAAVDGNIVKSIDEGAQWEQIYTSDDPNTVITTITMHPVRLNEMYAATNTGVVLVSLDRGISWAKQGEVPNRQFYKIEFHPVQTNVLYAGIEREGLARSFDRGETWQYFDEAFKEYTGAQEYRDFALIPRGIVYASRFGLLRSLTQGADWTVLPLISGKKDSNIQTLAVDDTDPLEIYYGTNTTFYHSIDGGFNWIPRALPSTRAASDIVIQPGNPDVLYLGVTFNRF